MISSIKYVQIKSPLAIKVEIGICLNLSNYPLEFFKNHALNYTNS